MILNTNNDLVSWRDNAGPKITKKDTGNRGAEGCGEGRPPPHWEGVWGGGSAPSPEKNLILYLKMATFSAFALIR